MPISSLVNDLPARRESRSLAVVFRLLNSNWLPVAIYVALVTSFWWPSLAHGMLILHGDAAHHGLSLLTMLNHWLVGGDSLLWASGAYGGHPLFAESQGGFLNPTNILGALFEPSYGFGVVHWLDMLLSGLGIYCLCRSLGICNWSALFAAIVVTYSSSWLGFQYNISVAGAMTWLPWLFWAVQYWLAKPSMCRALWMPAPAVLLIFAGYPQIAHGAAIYLVFYGLALAIHKEGRQFILSYWRKLLLGGAVALCVAVVLSAVQLIPLYELIQESHRSEGTLMGWGGKIPIDSYMAGLFFFDWQVKPAIPMIGSLASWGVLALAAMTLVLKVPFRVAAHLLPTFVLFNLGIEFTSPIFRFVYQYHLIPGLHGYRIMHPFLPLAVMGVAVLAAYILSVLSSSRSECRTKLLEFFGERNLIALVCLGVAGISMLYFDSSFGVVNYIYPIFICLMVCAFVGTPYAKLIPVGVVVVVILEAVIVKGGIFNFYPPSAVAQPESVRIIKNDSDHANFRGSVDRASLLFVFYPSNTAELDVKYGRFLNGLSPFPGILFGIPSIDGVLGLSLRRREILESTISGEMDGVIGDGSGHRLIDVLSIKYIARSVPTDAPGLEAMYRDESSDIVLYRNLNALPMLRAYARAEPVATAEQALERLMKARVNSLYIETSDLASVQEVQCESQEPEPARYTWVQRAETKHVVTIESECPGWLYLGDAYAPGWEAELNGVSAAVYPANVLGKAVRFPAGESTIEITYVPRSFLLGLTISCIGLLIWLSALWVYWRRRNE